MPVRPLVYHDCVYFSFFFCIIPYHSPSSSFIHWIDAFMFVCVLEMSLGFVEFCIAENLLRDN